MGRPAKEFKLKENQLMYLTGIRDNVLSDPDVCHRATALLALNDGVEINEIAASLGVTKYTVYKWRDSFLSNGIDSLQDAPRPGRGGQNIQDLRSQIDSYLSSLSTSDLQSVTAKTVSEQFHVSLYVARTILGKYNIDGERQRVWTVGITDSPIPKSADILGMYLSSGTAALVVATNPVGSLPMMNGSLRTECKAVAMAICDKQKSSSDITIADMVQITSAYLGKSDVHHHYMDCNAFFDETIVKRSYNEHVEFTILVYSDEQIRSNNLSRTTASIETKTYSSFDTWLESVSTVFGTLNRRKMQNKPSDFHDSLSNYWQHCGKNDEPFVWMKQPVSLNAQSSPNSETTSAEGQKLTTIYILESQDGSTFTCSFERWVSIPEIENFDLESEQFYQDFEALEQAIIESKCDSLNFAKKYLATCADYKAASGVELKERKIDAEIGQLPVRIGGTLLGGLRGREILSSIRFVKLAGLLVREISYHKATDLINEVTHRKETGSPLVVATSLSDRIKKVASGIVNYITEWTESTLSRFGFNPKKGTLKKGSSLPYSIISPNPYAHLDNVDKLMAEQANEIKKYTEYYNSTHTGDLAIKHTELIRDIELPGGHFVYISPDDVEAKHQKSKRFNKKEKTLGEKGGQKVQTTNVHIEVDKKWYAVTGRNMSAALRTTLAILLEKQLIENRQVIVFSDGARSIKNWTKTIFGFTNAKVIVDWKHLQKKCNEYFSMGLLGGKQNKDARGEIKREFYGRLWVGNYKEAIEYLNGLQSPPNGIVRNRRMINEMVAYIERKSYGITCYAVRRHLGLRLSSNRVEKLNDCDYSHRQKHNGMAWSHDGSHDLATLSATYINEEEDHWFKEKKLAFDFHE